MKKIILLCAPLVLFFSLFANAETKKMGTRLWLSEGETEWSHCASDACGGSLADATINGFSYTQYGDTTSQLTYKDTKAKVLEIFGDFSLLVDDSVILSFKLGVGSGDGGSFRDKDWVMNDAGVQKTFSDTLSDTRDTEVSYHVLDIGKTFERDKFSFKPFIGYMKYEEEVNAYGLTYLEDDLAYYGGGSSGVASSYIDTKVLKNEITWTGLRIGTELEYPIKEKSILIINAAYVHDAKADNDDSHVLRTGAGDLGPAPNIFSDGKGDGIMLDLILTHEQSSQLNFDIGYRYWKFDVDSSTTSFGPNHTIAFPGRSLYSERSGLIMGVSYKF